MNVPTSRLLAFAAAAVLLAASPAPAADAPPRKLDGLSKQQVQALPDNEKFEINGRTFTRSQLKLELEKGRAPLRADLQGQVRQKLQGFEQMKARSATTQAEKARALKASALAEAGKVASAVPTPTPKAPSGPPPAPKLTSVGAAYVMPGGGFMVAGQGLGAQAGTAKLEWKTQGGSVNLVVEIWKDNLAVLTVPGNVSGVIRQNARLVLTRTDNTSTNGMDVLFEPLTDMKLLPSHDLIVVCSNGADLNNCDPLPNQSFEGTHANTLDITSDTGTDKFKVNLKNGWVVEGHDFVTGGFTFGIGKGYSTHLGPITPGASTFDITVNFDVNPATNLEYYGMVYIRGPVGTSHK